MQARTMKKEYRFSAVIVFAILFLGGYILYQVQYKTGIDIIPLFPIDDSGFEKYNEQLLKSVKVSESARNQPKSGSLLCWAMTTSIYHKTRVPAITETWLKRCDAGHLFTNSDRFLNVSTPYHTVFDGLPESYYKLFWKTRLALLYIYKYISKDFDWYFKGDDDTYLIVENLQRYLSTLDPNKPYFIGYRLSRRTETGYNAGGSGYVMSREAMRIFAEQLFNDKNRCPYHEWEDYAIAQCLASVGIVPLDSRDEKGRQRFLPWRPEQHYYADLTRSFQMDPIKIRGAAIYHENLISMHHLYPDEIRLIDGLLYSIARGIWKQDDEFEVRNETTTLATSMDDTLPPPTV
uniref:N-acetylgalactosaminide beta-1,3-galactosyltransferase n=1 Tax=Caenorhabditis japonica TaxID=281687 RepID=A0A8R1DQK3_CAEJA